MLFSIPKLNDSKRRQDRTIYFLFFGGHDPASDMLKVELMFGWAPDLMHPMIDRGKAIPVLLAFQWRWLGPETRRMLNVGPDVIFRFRSDWREIWQRMKWRRARNADTIERRDWRWR